MSSQVIPESDDPERDDQLEHRRRRGHKGGRPPDFDVAAYRDRNVVERGTRL